MGLRVLISARNLIPATERFRPALEQAGIELVIPDVQERLSEQELMKYVGKIDGAVCGDDPFSQRVLTASSPRLRVISKWGTGLDSIDRDAAANLGVSVYNTPDAFTEPVADSVLAYILAFARRGPWMDRDLKSGAWAKSCSSMTPRAPMPMPRPMRLQVSTIYSGLPEGLQKRAALSLWNSSSSEFPMPI